MKALAASSSQITKFTSDDVHKIAGLANIPITTAEEQKLADGFTTTIGVVNQVFAVDVIGVPPMGNVTGLTNVFREDEVDVTRMFPQDVALSNAKRTHNGFIAVDQILEE